MTDIKVRVYQGGRLIDTVVRPLRNDGGRAVKYRRKLRALDDGDRLFLDGIAPLSEEDVTPLQDEPFDAPEFTSFVRCPGRMDLPSTWSDEQKKVIQAPIGSRILVAAPPGTGKTATACMRVAHLASTAPAHNIWVVSFTRVATGEFRTRVRGFSSTVKERSLAGLRVQTLDSLAWALASGFNENYSITGGFDQNIRNAISVVQTNRRCAEELAEVDHLIIDEAQDIVGIRAQMIHALIRAIPSSTGVTIFGDEAQAIYGYTLEDEGRADVRHLIDEIRSDSRQKFTELELTNVYRAGSDRLAQLVSEGRYRALSPEVPPMTRLDEMARCVRALADGESAGFGEESPPDSLFLFRRRFDVLNAVAGKHPTVARVRLTRFPDQLSPWIAVCLHDFDRHRLNEQQFANLWSQRLELFTPEISCEEAWRSLLTIGARGRAVDMPQLRKSLLRDGLAPGLARETLGTIGPLVSTIHAFKGREAREVHLAIGNANRAPESEEKDNEEARVLYVGATRATDRLFTYSPSQFRCSYLPASRTWRSYRHAPDRIGVSLELGREEDLDYESIGGMRFHEEEDGALELQVVLAKLSMDAMLPLTGSYEVQSKSYAIRTAACNEILGRLSPKFTRLHYDIAKKLGSGFRPGGTLKPFYMLGARTYVVPDDSPLREGLHRTWSASGLFLVPTLIGLPWITMYKNA